MSSWTVVYERTATGRSACVPTLAGVGVAGSTREDVEQLVTQAFELHLEGMIEDGLPIHDSGSVDIGQVELPIPA